jgi:hypothetical protein
MQLKETEKERKLSGRKGRGLREEMRGGRGIGDEVRLKLLEKAEEMKKRKCSGKGRRDGETVIVNRRDEGREEDNKDTEVEERIQ